MRLRNIITTVAMGALALSMTACIGGGEGQDSDADSTSLGIPMETNDSTPETEISEWDLNRQAAAQFLTDDEKKIFSDYVGNGNEAIRTEMTPVAFIAEQSIDGKPAAYAFLTQNTFDEDITWNIVVVYPNDIDPETNRPRQDIDFIVPDDLYVTETWEGMEGATESGWTQRVADMSNAPKLEDLTVQQVIDDYFANGIGGSRATFGPLGMRNKAGIKSYIYIVENETDGGQPTWLFVTLDEDANSNLTVSSCENIDIKHYLGIDE